VQSSTVLLLAALDRIARFDAATFAGTGWEPAAVYTHLDRLTALDADADVPIPGGPTPKQLGSNATFIPLTALTEGLSPKRTSASSGHPRST
jgi:hypothetical protein